MSIVRVNQSVIELVDLSSPNVRVNQSVIEFIDLPVSPIVLCGNSPGGLVGVPYTTTFPASGGVTPYDFTISHGSLPPGLGVNATTGVVTGTPTEAGTFPFTVLLTDADLNTASVPCSILIAGGTMIVVTQGQPISGGGPPKFKGGCTKDNDWDRCINSETYLLRRIFPLPLTCAIPKEFRNLLPWDEDFGAIPYQAVPFNIIGSISTPQPADGDVLVCQGMVPYGYDGILTGIYQTFYGTGFDNGGGDIVWRIQINQRYLLGLSNNPFAMGNGQNPIPLTEGQILLSGQRFRYFVNVPNTSGGVIIAGSRIVCAMLGFYWPR